MQFSEKCVIVSSISWFRCPRCRKRIARILPTSTGSDIVIPCRNCKIDWIATIQPAPKRPDSAE